MEPRRVVKNARGKERDKTGGGPETTFETATCGSATAGTGRAPITTNALRELAGAR
jgi:hypothetical protein